MKFRKFKCLPALKQLLSIFSVKKISKYISLWRRGVDPQKSQAYKRVVISPAFAPITRTHVELTLYLLTFVKLIVMFCICLLKYLDVQFGLINFSDTLFKIFYLCRILKLWFSFTIVSLNYVHFLTEYCFEWNFLSEFFFYFCLYT